MLGVVLFVLFWVLLGLTLFFIAARGGLAGARATLQTQSRGGRRTAAVSFAVLYVVFGVVFPLIFLTGNHAKASDQFAGVRLSSNDKHGREVFGQQCAVCHTLIAANATGKVGPNLDTLKPPASLVLNTINNGCLQSPPPGSSQSCLGQGTMPPQIVQGKDAQDVANFVAKVAGKE
ncbi:MAG: cytochrome c [Solirubrobacterales bacterium]|nr:cytochrome c [Solirubrobacterales bacterium]